MKKKYSIKFRDFDAFIFDMDGLLLDTERICWECFQKACSSYGYNPDFRIYRNCIGRKAEEGNRLLQDGFRNIIPFDKVNKEWGDRYHEFIENEIIPIKDGVMEFLLFLKENNFKLAVATSTELKTAVKKLTRTGLIDFFEIIITGDQVNFSKPDPEIYLKTAKMLAVDPKKCMAFEDSDNGVRSAFSAGITVVQIKDMIEPSDEVIKFNHTILNSFRDITLK